MCTIKIPGAAVPGAAVSDVPPQLVMVQGDDPQDPPLPIVDVADLTLDEGATSTDVESGGSNDPPPMFPTSPVDFGVIESWSADFRLAVKDLSLAHAPCPDGQRSQSPYIRENSHPSRNSCLC